MLKVRIGNYRRLDDIKLLFAIKTKNLIRQETNEKYQWKYSKQDSKYERNTLLWDKDCSDALGICVCGWGYSALFWPKHLINSITW